MTAQYILITAAKNEEAFIGKVIESVLRQTILPSTWFIMDDGSIDRTPDIIREFASKNRFIHLQTRATGETRNFGSQYAAIGAAYENAKAMEFDFVGIQDADITPERNDYYEIVIGKLGDDLSLGITGGYIYERAGGSWTCRSSNSPDSVAGGIQMFRRECFESIGGYLPLELGGSDWLAQLAASVKGWESRAMPELKVLHFRPSSSAGGRLRGHFRAGMMDASFGSRFDFEVLKCLRRWLIKPAVLGSIFRLAGYLRWMSSERRTIIPPDCAKRLREVQRLRLARVVRLRA